MLKRKTGSGNRANQAGMSIVELMVGIAVGLMVAAAASLLMSGQLGENRRLVTETQLQQDLRAAADIMSRELRRSGSNDEERILNSIWYPDAPANEMRNEYARQSAVAANQIDFYYRNPGSAISGNYGYKKQGTVLRSNLGGFTGWQDLTDANVMEVTSFTPSLNAELTSASIVLPCPTLCPAGAGTTCWPRFDVRLVGISVEARAKRDHSVQRAVSGVARIRNDYIKLDPSNATIDPLTGLPVHRLCPA